MRRAAARSAVAVPATAAELGQPGLPARLLLLGRLPVDVAEEGIGGRGIVGRTGQDAEEATRDVPRGTDERGQDGAHGHSPWISITSRLVPSNGRMRTQGGPSRPTTQLETASKSPARFISTIGPPPGATSNGPSKVGS